MYKIMEIAKKNNTSKNIILRIAANVGVYSPISKSKKFFSNNDVFLIEKEIQKESKRYKCKQSLTKQESNSFVDISREWNTNLKLDNLNFSNTCIDLFHGAGGITLGMVNAGFKPIVGGEIFKEAIETYKYNFKNFLDINFKENDVTDTKNFRNKEVDLIIGGFPCQGFSMAGIRSEEDPRNQLYLSMFEIVKNVKPKIVVMENVIGILSMFNKEGAFFVDDINAKYESIGYKLDYCVLNSADFEVPQIRKRVIMIANRIGKENLFPEKIIKDPLQYKTVYDAFSNLDYNDLEKSDVNFILTNHKKETLKKMSKLKFGESLYKTFSDAWNKLDPNKPSKTIKENHGGVSIHYDQNRVLTPRELALLQSFPKDFIFKGSKSKQLVQIGNAVPPLLAKAIGIAVSKMLEEN